MILGLLHGRVLAAASSGAIIAAPAYRTLAAYMTGSTSASALATFTLKADGTFTGDGTGYSTLSGLWYTPATGGIGAGYEVRMTATLTSGVGGILTNPTASWTAFTADLALQVTVNNFATGAATANYSVLVEIRTVGVGAIVSSNSFAMAVTANIASGGGGGGGCPTLDMWLGKGLRSCDVGVGHLIDAVEADTPESMARLRVAACDVSEQFCYRIVTRNGAACEISDSTPFTMRDGSTRYAAHMLDQQALRDDGLGAGGLVWDEIVACYPIGVRQVVKINIGGQSLLAGENPLMRIVSHNNEKV